MVNQLLLLRINDLYIQNNLEHILTDMSCLSSGDAYHNSFTNWILSVNVSEEQF